MVSFCLQSPSPTHYNLQRYLTERGWHSCDLDWQADFREANLQFHPQAAETLEYKHLLAQLVSHHCPRVMPKTYCINDENWPSVLNEILIHYETTGLIWILKPSLLNNGQEIKIFKKLSDLEQHYLKNNRLGGEHVLQHYITNPHLLRDNRKYSIRMFVVLTNYAGAYLYQHGYYNVATHPFKASDFTDLRPHLTNEHLKGDEVNVIQIPSERFTSFMTTLYPQIKLIVTAIIEGLQLLYPDAFICQKLRTLAIYGFDFLVDNCGRLWLLEANHGPCFPVSDDHPLQRYLYSDFWQDFIASFVEPIALNQPAPQIKYYDFESV